MELFHNNGHLTDEGLRAIVEGGLDELQSLEASEHLSFCDDCLLRYMTVMEGASLLEPERPLKDSVLKRIGRKTRSILFSRYGTVAAAAALVLGLWGTGFTDKVFADMAAVSHVGKTSMTDRMDASVERNVNGKMNEVAGGFTHTLNNFFSSLGGQPAAYEPKDAAKTATQQAKGSDDAGKDAASDSTQQADSDSTQQ